MNSFLKNQLNYITAKVVESGGIITIIPNFNVNLSDIVINGDKVRYKVCAITICKELEIGILSAHFVDFIYTSILNNEYKECELNIVDKLFDKILNSFD